MAAADHPSHARMVAEIGAAMFGEEWGVPMARLLGMNVRTMQRLRAAVRDGLGYPLSPGVLNDLAAALRQRAAEQQEWAQRLDQVAEAAERR